MLLAGNLLFALVLAAATRAQTGAPFLTSTAVPINNSSATNLSSTATSNSITILSPFSNLASFAGGSSSLLSSSKGSSGESSGGSSAGAGTLSNNTSSLPSTLSTITSTNTSATSRSSSSSTSQYSPSTSLLPSGTESSNTQLPPSITSVSQTSNAASGTIPILLFGWDTVTPSSTSGVTKATHDSHGWPIIPALHCWFCPSGGGGGGGGGFIIPNIKGPGIIEPPPTGTKPPPGFSTNMPTITLDPEGNPSYESSEPTSQPTDSASRSSTSTSESSSSQSSASCTATNTVTDMTYFISFATNSGGSTMGATTVSSASVVSTGCSIAPITTTFTANGSVSGTPITRSLPDPEVFADFMVKEEDSFTTLSWYPAVVSAAASQESSEYSRLSALNATALNNSTTQSSSQSGVGTPSSPTSIKSNSATATPSPPTSQSNSQQSPSPSSTAPPPPPPPPAPTEPTVNGPKCIGVAAKHYVPQLAMAANIKDFCSQAAKNPVQDPGSGSLGRVFNKGGNGEDAPDELSISMEWPPGMKFNFQEADCNKYMNSIMNSCDGNDPNNPLNFKAGGEVDVTFPSSGTVAYKIWASYNRPPVPKALVGNCQMGYKFPDPFDDWKISGAGWAGSDFGAALKAQLKGCTDTDWKFGYSSNDPYEWTATGQVPFGYKDCVEGAISSAGGPSTKCSGSGTGL